MSFRFVIQPAVYLLNRLKYPQKFALLSCIFLLPLGIAFSSLLSEVEERINFAQKERQGVKYLQSISAFKEAIIQSFYVSKTERIKLAWRGLENSDDQWGDTLSTQFPFSTLRREWQAWQELGGSTQVLWEQVNLPIQELQRRVGDQSNLILDPDLDSYYLMDTILITLPEIQRNLASIAIILSPQTTVLTPWQRAQIVVSRDMLSQLNQNLENNLQVAFNHAQIPSLETSLQSPLTTQIEAHRALISTLEEFVNSQTAVAPSSIRAITQKNLEATYKLRNQSAQILDAILQTRIEGLRKRQLFLASIVLIALTIAVYLFIGFYQSLMITLDQLREASQRLVAGTQTQGLILDTRDEMGEVVQSFDTIANALRVAEAKYRGIVENAVVGIYQTSWSGKYLTVNARLAEIYGYDSAPELIYQLQDIRSQLYVDGDRRQVFIDTLAQNQVVREFESQVYRKDRSIIWISESARGIHNEQGELVGFEGTVIDISQRKADELEIARLTQHLQDDNLRMGAELAVTRRLQQMLMPSERELGSVVGLDIAGFMEPAEEVGGDYYDIQQAHGKTRISIGDVTGHGLESNLVMIMAQTAVRTLLENGETDPARLLNAVNRTLYDNTRRMGSYKNMTLMLLEYEAGLLRLSGQHEELIVVRSQGQIESIDTFELGFPLGLETDIAHFVAETTLQLHSGDIAVLYTDGITEAMNPKRQQYGLCRLQSVILEHRTQSAESIRQAVIQDLRAWIESQKIFDDITLLVLKQQ